MHHVRSRGLSQRAIFESLRDVRVFLALLGCAVRAGRLEVMAFVIMTNHFHLFVRSTTGELSAAMQWLLGRYGSYFNRTRDRRGAIGESRYRSKLVESRSYERVLVWYMDMNPVEAGLVTSPELYPYGSSQHYVRDRGPPWLSRGLIERMVMEIAGASRGSVYDPRLYLRCIPRRPNPGLRELLERAIASRDPSPLADLDDLVGAARPHVRKWLARNAMNADGAPNRVIVAAATTVASLLASARAQDPDRELRFTRKGHPWWDVLECGLLHAVCGLTLQQIAERKGLGVSSVCAHVRAHRRGLSESSKYLQEASKVLHQGLERDLGTLNGGEA